jgi:hypothetical protein
MSLTATRPVPEYTAVRHILSSPAIAERCAPHIAEDDFDWASLLAESERMSGGEQMLVRIALDLWEAKGIVGLWELPRRLDRGNFARVLDALVMCRGEPTALGLRLLPNAA